MLVSNRDSPPSPNRTKRLPPFSMYCFSASNYTKKKQTVSVKLTKKTSMGEVWIFSMFTTSSSVFIRMFSPVLDIAGTIISWVMQESSFVTKVLLCFCHRQLTLFPMVTISTAMLIHGLSRHLQFHALCCKWRQRLTSCHWKQSQLPEICWAQLVSHETLVTNIFVAPPYTTDDCSKNVIY